VYIFVEFCPLGSLETYLKRNKFPKVRWGPQYDATLSFTNITPEQFFSWAHQTALGMTFLSGKGIVHGDLATRNLLLMNVNHLKITDFGLAKQLEKYSVYKREKRNDKVGIEMPC
jgi:serine/threonine protein kinase